MSKVRMFAFLAAFAVVLAPGLAVAQVQISVYSTAGTNDGDLTDGFGEFYGPNALMDAVWGMQHNFDGAGNPPPAGATDDAVITIMDSGVFSGTGSDGSGYMMVGVSNLTIQAAPGEAPTVQAHGVGETFNVGRDYTGAAQPGSLNLIGSDPENPILLLTPIGGSHCVVGSGPDWGGDCRGLYVESVVFQSQPDAADAGHPFTASAQMDASTTFEFLDCVFNMGPTTYPPGMNGPWLHTAHTTFTNCDFNSEGYWYMGTFGNSVTVLNNCFITGQGGNLNATMTFNQCGFGPNAHPFRQDAWSSGQSANLTFDDCVFDNRSDVAVGITVPGTTVTFQNCDILMDRNYNPAGLDLDGDGTADGSPTPVAPTAAWGVFYRVRAGELNFIDCNISGGTVWGFGDQWGDPNNAATLLQGDMVISFENCLLDGRGGDIWRNAAGTADGAPGDSLTMNYTNCVFTGAPLSMDLSGGGATMAGHIVAFSDQAPDDVGPGTLNLLHCTFLRETSNAHFFGNADRGDVVNWDGTIINPPSITASHVLSAIPVQHGPANIQNLAYVNVADDGTGNPYEGGAGLGADIVMDPRLDAAGYLMSDSPALGTAYGSTLAYDIDGNPRPQPDWQNPDIGARESDEIGPLADTDGDGMPDWWEIQYGLDPTDPSDAHEDLDGDGYTNLEEYLAGTDPTDPEDFPTPMPAATLAGLALLGLALASVATRRKQ